MELSKLAGKPADPSLLINVPRLVTAYYTGQPDPSVPSQRVVFGTSGHRGSALTDWIERQSNPFIGDGLRGVARVPFERARSASTVHPHPYLASYVRDLPSVIDREIIRESKVRAELRGPITGQKAEAVS